MNGTIFIKKKIERNFTIIPNEILRDERLSWKAVGLLVYLLHLPPDWELNLEHLSNCRADRHASTRSGIGELEQFGYVVIERERDSCGQFRRTVWTVTDHPTPGIPKQDDPQGEEQSLVKPWPEKSILPNTEKNEILNLKNTTTTLARHEQKFAEINSDGTDLLGFNENELFYPNVDEASLVIIKETLEKLSVTKKIKQEVLDEVEGWRRDGSIKQGVIPFLYGVVKNLKMGNFSPHKGVAIKRRREASLGAKIAEAKGPIIEKTKRNGAFLDELRLKGLLKK